jgi:hypothetical protein
VTPAKDLRECLARIRHCGFITITKGGVIDYGPEAIRIASTGG